MRGGGEPALAGDFVDLYEREHALLVRRAALLLGSVEAAHDVVHDAFVEVYRRWDDLGEPGPYLNRVVVNRCRDHERRRRFRAGRTPLLAERGEHPEEELLWDVLQRLPFPQRAVVVLRFYLQLSEREIADQLGCPTGSVGPWLHRAMATMREELT
jgi:RNA polymerase sigma factor (sigma-70 family)